MITFQLLPKFSFRIILAFILFTVVGTQLHELGHVAVAQYYGYHTELHYGSMNYYYDMNDDSLYVAYRKLVDRNLDSIKSNKDFVEKPEYNKLRTQLEQKYPRKKKHSTFISSGGPIQTILTSFLGIFILFYRKSRSKQFFKVLDWLGVFLALFILREVFNFVMASYSFLFYGKENFNGDEFKISRDLGYNEWVIPSITCIIGIIISLYVIFKIIPMKYRFTFIISGLIGGIAGFAIWFGFLGVLLLP